MNTGWVCQCKAGFPAFYFLTLQTAMHKILQVDGGHGYDVSPTVTETRGLGVCA